MRFCEGIFSFKLDRMYAVFCIQWVKNIQTSNGVRINRISIDLDCNAGKFHRNIWQSCHSGESRNPELINLDAGSEPAPA
jgi:hypothetical protein